MERLTVAVVQMVSGMNVNDNVQRMRYWVQQAVMQGAKWVVLPEYWFLMGQQDTDKLAWAEPLGTGYLQTALSAVAKEHQITLFAGTIPLMSRQEGKVLNSLLVYGADGILQSCYDKIHLFGYSGLGEHFAEADTIEAGRLVPSLLCDGWKVAQGICYDVRFPELFRQQLPFEVLVLPAAFTATTGKAHWELLLRARAVENQCYVLAAGQGGLHENGRTTFGHSMIIDPWGEVMTVLPEREGVLLAELSPCRLHSVRSRLPALQHRVL